MIDFPASPTVGQIFSAAGASWQWDGVKWVPFNTGAGAPGAIPSGSMWAFAGAVAPTNWLLCNGAAVSRTTYALLFAAIGTAYGVGDGSTTFNLPDMRGRIAAGLDPSNASGRLTTSAAGGASASALGNTGGEQAHVTTLAETAVHSHGVNDASHGHGVNDPSHGHGVTDPTHRHFSPDGFNFMTTNTTLGTAAGAGKWDNTSYSGLGTTPVATGIAIQASGTGVTIAGSLTGVTIQNNGSGAAHNTVQPTLIVNWIIKT